MRETWSARDRWVEAVGGGTRTLGGKRLEHVMVGGGGSRWYVSRSPLALRGAV